MRIRDEFRAVEEALGYRFKDPGLLEHALTHRSRAHEDASGGVRDNESLEFLGDAVLGFVISARLFRECPDWNEGQKSKARAVLVSTAGLARVGERLGLGDHLLLGRGEERTGGRTKRSLIADTFEAVVAAVYLDGGVEGAEGFIEQWFRPELDAVRAGEMTPGMSRDHKSALQERLQSRDQGLPRYELVGTTGPPHRRVFETEIRVGERALARGEGRSKKESEQCAAERALAVPRRGRGARAVEPGRGVYSAAAAGASSGIRLIAYSRTPRDSSSWFGGAACPCRRTQRRSSGSAKPKRFRRTSTRSTSSSQDR